MKFRNAGYPNDLLPGSNPRSQIPEKMWRKADEFLRGRLVRPLGKLMVKPKRKKSASREIRAAYLAVNPTDTALKTKTP